MRERLLPSGATRDAGLLLETRGIRGFGDGLVSVVLAAYLAVVGLSDVRIGDRRHRSPCSVRPRSRSPSGCGPTPIRVAGLLQLVAAADGRDRRRVRRLRRLLAAGGGGTDRHAEPERRRRQRVPADRAGAAAGDRPRRSAHRPVRPLHLDRNPRRGGRRAGAGVPDGSAIASTLPTRPSLRWAFVAYAVLGVVVLTRYRRLSPAVERVGAAAGRPLGKSKRIVYRLAALFSLDAFGGGFVITALLVLWLQRRFGLSIAATARCSSGPACCPPSRRSSPSASPAGSG